MKQFLVLLPLIFVQPAIAQVSFAPDLQFSQQIGQIGVCNENGCTQYNPSETTFLTPIDRAMNICKKHKIVQDNQVYLRLQDLTYPNTNNHPYYYDDKWKNCSKIENKWNESETAKKLKAEKEQEQRDLEFVNKQAE